MVRQCYLVLSLFHNTSYLQILSHTVSGLEIIHTNASMIWINSSNAEIVVLESDSFPIGADLHQGYTFSPI